MVFYLRTGNWYSLHKIVENMKGCKELFDVSINGQGCHWLTAHAGGCALHHSASVYVIYILRSNLFSNESKMRTTSLSNGCSAEKMLVVVVTQNGWMKAMFCWSAGSHSDTFGSFLCSGNSGFDDFTDLIDSYLDFLPF